MSIILPQNYTALRFRLEANYWGVLFLLGVSFSCLGRGNKYLLSLACLIGWNSDWLNGWYYSLGPDWVFSGLALKTFLRKELRGKGSSTPTLLAGSQLNSAVTPGYPSKKIWIRYWIETRLTSTRFSRRPWTRRSVRWPSAGKSFVRANATTV